MTARSAPAIPIPTPAPKKARKRNRGMRARLSTLRDLTRHFSGTSRWWLLPMIIIFLLSAAVLVLVQIIEYAAPFVYTLF